MSPSATPLRRYFRSPLFWILCGAAVLRLAGIFWGLPASDGWDDDGVAPRNFLVGIAQTYTPGSYFAYPPFHMFLIAVPTAPGWIAALLNAPALNAHAVIAEMIQGPYMTFFAATARLIGAALSVGTIYLIARIAEAAAGRRAGLFAAAALTLNAALTYYGQVSNLDGPYLFWSALSLWGWMRTIAEREPRHIRWAVLAAAAALTTKDQAYAVFLFSVPAALLLWFLLDAWPRKNARAVAKELLMWSGAALVLVLVIDGVVINPAGFAKRLALLTGPASRDYAQYLDGWSGRLALLRDMGAFFPRYYPLAALLPAAAGLGLLMRKLREDHAHFVAGLLPLLAILSFTVAFNFAALRTEPRFLLPQSVFLAVYIGIGAEGLIRAAQPWARLGVWTFLAATGAWAFYQCGGVAAAFVNDPRYEAEQWMNAHVRPGDTIETYGLNAYLPRFPGDAHVSRVGPRKARNPLPGVTELVQPYDEVSVRQPRFIVVSGYWAADYLAAGAPETGPGRAVQSVRLANQRDAPACRYFQALFGGRLPYRLALKAEYRPGFWPVSGAYESLEQTVFLFERGSSPGAQAEPGARAVGR